MGDLALGLTSEIPWDHSAEAPLRFVFDYPQICLIVQVGEAHIAEYGRDELVGSCRDTQLSALSVRLLPARGGQPDVRRIAHLLDPTTALVRDMASNVSLASVKHTCRIVSLDISPTCSHLLYRDSRRVLHLHCFESQEAAPLLGYCTFAAWVPGADVIVAQSRSSLNIWYSVRKGAASPTVIPIKGDVLRIERAGGRTEARRRAAHPLGRLALHRRA